DDHSYLSFMGWQVRENKHWWGEMGRLRLLDYDQAVSPSSHLPIFPSPHLPYLFTPRRTVP
ncbi:MAG: hypothetical protein AAF152_21100, partial [Cyanobacteria bacterium P01_A01_bin.114]